MTNGSITIAVSPGELISLRSAHTGGKTPATPSGLIATALSSNQINLGWFDNSNNETGFTLRRKTGATGTYGIYASVGANVTMFNDTGLAPSTTYYYQVNANNASGDSAWSNEAGATTNAPPTGGLVAGTVAPAASSYDLTALGTSDWAHWNGTFIHKASGGSQISDVMQIGGGNYGSYADPSRNVSWSDGTPVASGTNDNGYIWSNGNANSGWAFTVPAGAAARTLHVVLGGPGSTTQITAHLSDGSAPDFVDTETNSGFFTLEYALTYHAISPGQTLTVPVTHVNSGGPSADLVAAWLP